jgi:hypothetical protein
MQTTITGRLDTTDALVARSLFDAFGENAAVTMQANRDCFPVVGDSDDPVFDGTFRVVNITHSRVTILVDGEPEDVRLREVPRAMFTFKQG